MQNRTLLIELQKQETKSAGGIVLQAESIDEQIIGKVVAKSEFSYHLDGTLRDSPYKVGDNVILQRGQIGTTMPTLLNAENCVIVPEDCILAIVEIEADE